MPLAVAYSLRPGRNPLGGTIKPPSPWIGSIMIAATFFAPISFSILCVTSASASAVIVEASPIQRYAYGIGMR